MAKEQRSYSITGEVEHNIYHILFIIIRCYCSHLYGEAGMLPGSGLTGG